MINGVAPSTILALITQHLKTYTIIVHIIWITDKAKKTEKKKHALILSTRMAVRMTFWSKTKEEKAQFFI